MKTIKNGFTMLELLVVIVIIGLLAAMLFPVYGRVQARGREVKCSSNLRQLFTATMSFVSNNDGRFPSSASAQVYTRYNEGAPWNPSGWTNGWVASHPMNTVNMRSYWYGSNGIYCVRNGSVFPYLGDQGDESVYVCPTMMKAARSAFPSSDVRSLVARSYGMNNLLGDPLAAQNKYSTLDGVSRIILFADQGFDNMGLARCLSNTGLSVSDPVPAPTAPRTGRLHYRRFYRNYDGSIEDGVEYIGELHGNRPGRNTGSANVIFCDGHVERVTYLNTTNVCRGNWEYGRPVQ